MVGRQPILDRQRRLFAYELLFKPAGAIEAAEVTPDEATAHVIADGLLTFGLDRLTSGHKAFIELSPAFVQHDVVKLLPPNQIVLQVPASAAHDDRTVDACHRLRAEGYQLALSHFTDDDADSVLLPLADYVKMDFLSAQSRHAQARLQGDAGMPHPAMIASRVEAVEVFNEAVREGFSHFQGYFFERPSLLQTRSVPRGQVGYLRLLHMLNDPSLSLNDLEDLMKHDASLCFRLLKTVNSAAFAQSREVTSIRHALLLLGRDTIRRWASLWVMADLGAAAHPELVQMASIRGRFCELLTARRDGPDAAGEGFLLGMCSCLDAILQRPMSAILEELPLSSLVAGALLGRENHWRCLLDCVMAYERGDWDMCMRLADVAGLDRPSMPPMHADALAWAHHVRSQTATTGRPN
jgi:EAL and modified HD-GYP domain-containing signal transduction protein